MAPDQSCPHRPAREEPSELEGERSELEGELSELEGELSELEGELSELEGELSELERAILEFERQWWKQAGAKESAIRARFDLSATRYYQVLNRLLDSAAAFEAEPAVVGRLRRLRAERGG